MTMYGPLLTRLYIYMCFLKPNFRENSIKIEIGFCF